MALAFCRAAECDRREEGGETDCQDELGGEEGRAGRCTNTHYYGIITTSWARRYFVSLGGGDREPFGGLLDGITDGGLSAGVPYWCGLRSEAGGRGIMLGPGEKTGRFLDV